MTTSDTDSYLLLRQILKLSPGEFVMDYAAENPLGYKAAKAIARRIWEGEHED